MTVRSSLRAGLVAGLIGIFMVLLGLTQLAGQLVRGWLRLTSEQPGAWLALLLLGAWAGSTAFKQAKAETWKAAVLGGLVAGAATGLLMGAFMWGIGSLLASGTDLRKWLVQLSAANVRLLTLGLSPFLSAILIFAAMALFGAIGAALPYASGRYHWRDAWAARRRGLADRVVTQPAVSRFLARPNARQILLAAGLVLLLLLPLGAGQYWNYIIGTIGIYVILGLGLNMIVGMAGLLNLGYGAFFAIGAYTVAMLTAPEPHHIVMNYWLAVPIAIIAAGIAGVLLGIPVLRMRGDYLAIVTLGFAEIIRILSRSDALTGLTGGPRGIRSVGGPELFGIDLNNEIFFTYFILVGIVVAAFITHRLQNSRVGRAWMAMREDEDVAEAMGVNVLIYKLLALAIGVGFAGFGGAIFASRNRFTGPEDFTLLVSINVLCLVIIGGMGSIPGVLMGALVLKGLPEILRQLDNYRMLAFGALLVVMMIVRPEGLWPSARQKNELRAAEEGPTVAPGAEGVEA